MIRSRFQGLKCKTRMSFQAYRGGGPGFFLLLTVFLLAGCGTERPHSILDPAGPAAELIAGLWWRMLWVYGLVFIATLVLLILALVVRRRETNVLGFRFVFLTGVAIPTVILIIMLVDTLRVMGQLHAHEEDLRIKVVSHHWWFEVQYPGYDVIDANEIHIPTGKTVRFDLISEGVIHSFWVPRLGGKRDMLPDHFTELHLKANQPGVYQGTCTEYCAGTHALMNFRLVAHEPEDFTRWLEFAAQQPHAPEDAYLQRGREAFMRGGCAACHAVKGVSRGILGPNLTLVGARLTLGAGTIENNKGNLAGWIANSQAIKPGNMMPKIYLEPEDLHALVDYLWSLQ